MRRPSGARVTWRRLLRIAVRQFFLRLRGNGALRLFLRTLAASCAVRLMKRHDRLATVGVEIAIPLLLDAQHGVSAGAGARQLHLAAVDAIQRLPPGSAPARKAAVLSRCVLEWQTAHDFILTALAEEWRNPSLYVELEHCLSAIGRDADHLDLLAGPQEATPASGYGAGLEAASLYQVGRLYERFGRWDDAGGAFRLGLRHAPDDPWLQYSVLAHGILSETLKRLTEEPFAASAASTRAPALLIPIAVWGRRYLELMAETTLAGLFRRENREWLSQQFESELLIFTSEADLAHAEKAVSALPVAARCVAVDDRLFGEHPDKSRMGSSSAAVADICGALHMVAASVARARGAYLMTLSPDLFLRSGLVGRIWQTSEEGRKLVLAAGLRTRREEMLNSGAGNADNGTLDALAHRFLHPAVRALFLNSPRVTYPGMVWAEDAEGRWHGRAFGLHPILVPPEHLARHRMRRVDSIDGEFVSTLLPDAESWSSEIAVLDDLVIYEHSGRDVEYSGLFDSRTLAAEAAPWLRMTMRPYNIWLAGRKFSIAPARGGSGAGSDPVRTFAAAQAVDAAVLNRTVDDMLRLLAAEPASCPRV